MSVKSNIRYTIGKCAAALGYDIRPAWKAARGNIHPLKMATELLLGHQKGLVELVVQVGVFDGIADDPLPSNLFSASKSVVLVEPQPSCVKVLRKRYGGDPKVTILDLAIAEQSGEMTLFSESLNSQRASLSRTHVEKFSRGNAALAYQVKCITPATLFETLGSKAPDLLQVDTEGMDWRIIVGLFEAGCFPKVLNFENFHLTKEERSESRELLGKKGYYFLEYGYDTCAICQNLF